MADQMPDSAKIVTASLWLERAEKHNPILPTLGSPMAAAVAEEMEEYADRKLADFLVTRAAPPAMDREAVAKVREAERICRDTADRATHMLDREDRRWQPTRAHYEGLRNALRNAESTLSTLSADAIRQGEGISLNGLSYDQIWGAIADATSIAAPGQIAISVMRFRAAVERLSATPAPAVDAQEALRMWQVKGPCNTIMWETNRTSGQFADPVAAVSCALSLPLRAPAVDAVPAGEGERRTDAEIVEQTNDLARQFYARRGYEVQEGYRFDRATHPHEVEAWDMACMAMEALTDTDAQSVADDLADAALSHGEGR